MCQNLLIFHLARIDLIPVDTSSHIRNIQIFIPADYSSMSERPHGDQPITLLPLFCDCMVNNYLFQLLHNKDT